MVDGKKFPYAAKSSDPDEQLYYSELQVLMSFAGYYIGRMCWVEDKKLGGYPEPGSRESDYYLSREAAQKDLDDGLFGRPGHPDGYAPETEQLYQDLGKKQPLRVEDIQESFDNIKAADRVISIERC
jgi:hypothetical protein